MITGTTPDVCRDYKLDKEISGLLSSFREIADRLREEIVRVESLLQNAGSEVSMLEEIAAQLESFIDDPQTIPERLSRYKENISTLGSWLLRMKEQALELDSFFVYSPDQKLPKASASFWDQLCFDVQAFLDSFINDYNSIGNTYSGNSSLTVWAISAGRDQLQIVKSLIDDHFTPETGIGVNPQSCHRSRHSDPGHPGRQGPRRGYDGPPGFAGEPGLPGRFDRSVPTGGL